MNIQDVTNVTNHEQVTRHLLEAKANIEAKQNEGWTAIMFASSDGHADVRAC